MKPIEAPDHKDLNCLVKHPRRVVEDNGFSVCADPGCTNYVAGGDETQQTISLWAEETFGSVGSNMMVACRANQEMAELLMELAKDDNSPKAGEEAADTCIVFMRLFERLKLTLQGEINRKMKINRGRQWNLDGKGHGYHVKTDPTPVDREIVVGKVLTLKESALRAADGEDLDFIGNTLRLPRRDEETDDSYRSRLMLRFQARCLTAVSTTGYPANSVPTTGCPVSSQECAIRQTCTNKCGRHDFVSHLEDK